MAGRGKLITTKQAAVLANVSVSYLEKLRSKKKGARYVKLGNSPSSRVFYYEQDFLFWLECHMRDPEGFTYD